MAHEPQTLAEMQEMNYAEFRQVERYKYNSSLSPTRVIRHMVELASEELSWQGRENANSLRDFWYNPCKSIMETAFPEKYGGSGTSKFNRRMSQALSEVTSDLVKEGEVTYRDLNILDDSRDRRINTDTIESDKVIFVEKNSAYRKLRPLEEVYDLSIVSGSGWQATALIEDMVHELDADSNTQYTVYLLSDYDPTGFGIAEDFAERARLFGINVEAKRIGISPEQVDDDVIESQKFNVAVNGDSDREWVRRHGIGGEPYGLEIEAVGGDLQEKAANLRRLVVDAIKDDIRTDEHRKSGVASACASGASYAVNDILEDVRTRLREEAASILEQEPAVPNAYYSTIENVIYVTRDDEMLNPREDSYVPAPFMESDLHEGAVQGDEPSVRTRDVKKNVREELRRQIRDGEIEPSELFEDSE